MPKDSHDSDKTRNHTILTKGTIVSHYRIVEKIGAGGMGEVFLADDTELDRKVALKFLPSHLCQDEDCRRRFTREAQATASLNHPNIVTIYEVGEFQRRPFFAMEHVGGQPLKDHIRGMELELGQIISYALQLCEGLSEAHSAGVVHRDIKPSNIVIDSNNRPRLLDFGLAAVQESVQLTKTGSTLGTVGYMSPEQIQGKDVDARSDLFSLGVVLYEMITGQRPFKGGSEATTLNSVLNDSPEPLSRYKSGPVDDIQRIVTKLLQKDPAMRYQTAADVIPDLRLLSTDKSGVPPKDWWNHYVVPSAVLVLLVMAGYWMFSDEEQQTNRSERKMLAVLPFENLGAPEDEYFADGMTEEITTNLARLSGLGVISRTSTMQYKDTDKSLREIAKELGVEFVVEGTIRWDKTGANSRVRINPQLIQVLDDVHLWADQYDAVITDIFDVQSKIARQIASALDVTLLQSEEDALLSILTIDPVAYDFYLRGKQHFSLERSLHQEPQLAERMHLRAIELEPEFALPYAELGALYTDIYWEKIDPSEEWLDKARQALDRALKLAPNLPETHQAMGWYYYHGLRDYGRALQEFAHVLKLQPNNAMAFASIAWVHRRQGKWDEAIDGLQRAIRLDPRQPWYHYELGMTFMYCRRYQEAVSLCDKVIEIQPSHQWAYIIKSWSLFHQTGETSIARAVLEEALKINRRWSTLTLVEVYLDMCDRNYDHALSLIQSPGNIYLYEDLDTSSYYLEKGRIYVLMGEQSTAQFYLDSARVFLERLVGTMPDVARYHSALGMVYALLGQKDEAIQAAQQSVEMLPVTVDALGGSDQIVDLAVVLTASGEYEQAITLIDDLLQIPSHVSVNFLRMSPAFDPLRDNPRFAELLERYADRE